MNNYKVIFTILLTTLISGVLSAQSDERLYRKINSDGKEGFVNDKEEWIIAPKYDLANHWLCGTWVQVKSGDISMIVNAEGEKMNIPFTGFSSRAIGGYIEVNSDDKKNALLCNCNTGKILDNSRDRYDYFFGLGDNLYIVGSGEKWLIMDLKGDRKPIEFPRISLNFRNYTGNGLLTFWSPSEIGILDAKSTKINTIDAVETFLTPSVIKEDRLVVSSLSEGAGVVDMNGEFIVKFKYDEIADFHNGYARTTKFMGMDNDRHGLIDKNGNEVFPVDYASIEVVKNGSTLEVIALDTTGTILYMNLMGNAIKPQKGDNKYYEKFYPDVVAELYNCFIIGSPGKYGIVTKEYKLIEPRRNFNIRPIPETNNYFMVERSMGGLYSEQDDEADLTFIYTSVFDGDGNMKLPDIHLDFVSPSWQGSIGISTGKRGGILDEYGRVYMIPYPTQALLSEDTDVKSNLVRYYHYATLKSAMWYDQYNEEICKQLIKWGIKEGDTVGVAFAVAEIAKHQKDPRDAYMKLISKLMDAGSERGRIASAVVLLSHTCNAGDYYTYTGAHLGHELFHFNLFDVSYCVDFIFKEPNWIKNNPDKINRLLENCYKQYKRDEARLTKKEFKSLVGFYKSKLDAWENLGIDVSKYKNAI